MERQYVIFTMDNEYYGISIEYVSEIIRMVPITKIPKNPDFVEGVVNLRGKIIPVIDLKRQLDMGSIEIDSDTRIMVVTLGEETVGLIVEQVSEVFSMEDKEIEQISTTGSKVNVDFIQGFGKWHERLIMILQVDKILMDQELKQLAAMGQDNIQNDIPPVE